MLTTIQQAGLTLRSVAIRRTAAELCGHLVDAQAASMIVAELERELAELDKFVESCKAGP